MKTLSKSKLIAYRQCPKRLWLEVHHPELQVDSSKTQAAFATGHTVGKLARSLYDPGEVGEELDLATLGMTGLLQKTQELLGERRPIFEAGFATQGPHAALALADVLLPDGRGRAKSWRMIEVKSTTSVKDYHRDDAAIQHYIASEVGINLSGLALAYIDSSWTYLGDGNYQGLLVEEDLTQEALARRDEVRAWIADAHKVAALRRAPEVAPGAHCGIPFECGFAAHCSAEDEAKNGKIEFPVSWLPRIQAKALKEHIETNKPRSLADVPDDLLNPTQIRVKRQSLSGRRSFDAAAAASALAGHALPAMFLDFETISHAVPVWTGTRPYQVIPFQFSLHRLFRTGRAEHSGFLDLTGRDPSKAFANALVQACEGREPIFVYSRSFEGTRIRELAERFPRLATKLMAIEARLVDLLPTTQAHYYHPAQQGSWSIKAVLPTIAPELSYANLAGVQDGGGAQQAFLEAVHPDTSAQRKQELREQLWRYCRLDTFAMIRLWAYLASRTHGVKAEDDAPSAVLPA